MSHIARESVACPACGATQEVDIFRSLNGERVPFQVEKILAGTFEETTCGACAQRFQPEHRMLYAHYALRTWVVMHPRSDQPEWAVQEHGVDLLFADRVREAPTVVQGGLRGVRPRLVYGQAFLAEAVRTAEAGLEPALLECAKMLAYKRSLGAMIGHGPVELCFEGLTADGQLQLAVLAGRAAARVDTLPFTRDVLDEVQTTRAAFEARWPDLFTRPYVSATRYLFGALT